MGLAGSFAATALLAVSSLDSRASASCPLVLPPAPNNEVDTTVASYYPSGTGGLGVANNYSLLTINILNASAPVPTGQYAGWCVDFDTPIALQPFTSFFPFSGQIFSSCDPNLNSLIPAHPNAHRSAAVWHQVNWIINHRTGLNYGIVQEAIWRLVGGPNPGPSHLPGYNNAAVTALVANSAAQAPSWVPLCGDKTAAVISYDQNYDPTQPDVQLVIVEVPIVCASIGNFVWHDKNANGQQDGGEPGIPGVKVELYDCDGNFIKDTTTDGNGNYKFSDLIPGDYKVKVINPGGGYIPSPSVASGASDATDSDADQTTGIMNCTTLSPGEYDDTWDAGFYKLAQLGNYVWVDLDEDGVQNDGNTGVNGVVVKLLYCDGTPVLDSGGFPVTTVTADDGSGFPGYYQFTGLMPGCYKVEFVKPCGYKFTMQYSPSGTTATDSDADTTTGVTGGVNLASGDSYQDLDAGLICLPPVLNNLPAPTAKYECLADVPGAPTVTATDDCDVSWTVTPVVTESNPGSSCNNVIKRVWTATTACGKSVSFTQTITVDDKTAPDVTKGAIGTCYLTVAAAEAAALAATSATDNCTPPELLVKTASTVGTCEAKVTVKVTDLCGNEASVEYNVKIDGDAPVFSGLPGATAAYKCIGDLPTPPEVTALDNCDGPVIPLYNEQQSNPGSSCDNVIKRTWTVVDSCGNVAQFTQTITVDDDEAPVLPTLPAGGDLGCNPVLPTCNNSLTATDNCGNVPVICTPGPIEGTGCAKSQTFKYSATDACGNETTDYVTYTWKEDSEKPVVSGIPAGGDLGCNPANIPTVESIKALLTANDNCGEATITVLMSSRDERLCGKVRQFVITATDACGNTSLPAQVLYTWTQDTTAPVLSGIPVGGDLGCNPANIPTAASIRALLSVTETCSKVALTVKESDGGDSCNKSRTFEISASDGCGNATTPVRVTYTWKEDTTAPTLPALPAGGDLGCNPTLPTCANGLVATDNCGNVPVVCTPGAITTSGNVKSQKFTYSATDACGNSVSKDVTYTWTTDCAPCVEGTFSLGGGSNSGTGAGNVRTFSVNGISAKATAFSRDASGVWTTAYLGSYTGGLGVTDNSEGDGSNNRHTLDNIDQRNYILIEFNQAVAITGATLGYVVDDSDLTIWVGSATDPYNNHQTLSDAFLAGLGYTEDNDTTLTTARTAAFNAGKLTGNVFVIAASTSDTTPEDKFKVQSLGICAPAQPQAQIGDKVWDDLNANGVQDGGEPGVNGVKVDLYKCDNTFVATTTTAGGGLYSFTVPPGSYYVKFSALPAGYVFSPSVAGGASDPTDSDANPATGKTDCTTLVDGENDKTWDAGINKPVACVENTVVSLTGGTCVGTSAGNIRTFTVNGISVKASAFSRTSAGSWATAYLGQYSGGLGVTDSSEGDGSNNRHTVDNIDRNNYVLFEFSQSVVLNSATLGYVVDDSDLSVWIGNIPNAFNNHQTLSDALLTGLGYTEDNTTTSTAARTADLNAGERSGNILVIAAWTGDDTPEDKFKIQSLSICGHSAPATPPACPANVVATPNNCSVSLTWAGVNGATSYKVKRATNPAGPYTVVKSGFNTTSWTDTSVSNGTVYYYIIIAVNAAGESTGCDYTPSIPSAPLPSPWCKKDIGTLSCITGASCDSYGKVYTVNGSGADIWGTDDKCRFVYQPASGDCSITVKVCGVENTHDWAKAGVMIRETLNGNSKHASVFCTPSNGVAFQYRNTTGGSSGNVNTAGLNSPYWLKIVRSGNTFTAYRSSTGASGTWTNMGSQTIYMGTTCYIGMAVTSHDDAKICTSTFDYVTVNP